MLCDCPWAGPVWSISAGRCWSYQFLISLNHVTRVPKPNERQKIVLTRGERESHRSERPIRAIWLLPQESRAEWPEATDGGRQFEAAPQAASLRLNTKLAI
jgi:hypothetical protein